MGRLRLMIEGGDAGELSEGQAALHLHQVHDHTWAVPHALWRLRLNGVPFFACGVQDLQRQLRDLR